MTSRETRGEDDGSRARPGRAACTRGGGRDESRSVIGSWCVAARAIGNRRETAALPTLTDALVARFAKRTPMKLLTGIATVAAVATVARAGDAPPPFVPPAVTGETAFLETFTGGLGGWIGSENDKYTGARPPRSPAIAARRSRRTPRAERPAGAIRPEDRAIAPISTRATRSRAVFFPTSRSGRPAASEKRLAPRLRRLGPRWTAGCGRPPLNVDAPSERPPPSRASPTRASSSARRIVGLFVDTSCSLLRRSSLLGGSLRPLGRARCCLSRRRSRTGARGRRVPQVPRRGRRLLARDVGLATRGYSVMFWPDPRRPTLCFSRFFARSARRSTRRPVEEKHLKNPRDALRRAPPPVHSLVVARQHLRGEDRRRVGGGGFAVPARASG